MLINTNIKIEKPEENQVVFFQPFRKKYKRVKKPYPVIITDLFLSKKKDINIYRWQRLTPTGIIRPKIEYGYGNFTIAKGYDVEIIRKIKIIK